jgi:hypothetical protein
MFYHEFYLSQIRSTVWCFGLGFVIIDGRWTFVFLARCLGFNAKVSDLFVQDYHTKIWVSDSAIITHANGRSQMFTPTNVSTLPCAVGLADLSLIVYAVYKCWSR